VFHGSKCQDKDLKLGYMTVTFWNGFGNRDFAILLHGSKTQDKK